MAVANAADISGKHTHSPGEMKHPGDPDSAKMARSAESAVSSSGPARESGEEGHVVEYDEDDDDGTGERTEGNLPARQFKPTPSRPLVFFHLEKCGGSTMR